MRKTTILVIFALSMIAQSACAWWAAAARGIQPIMLSFGAAFATLGLNDYTSHDELFDVKELFKNKFASEDKVSKPKSGPKNLEEQLQEINQAWKKPGPLKDFQNAIDKKIAEEHEKWKP